MTQSITPFGIPRFAPNQAAAPSGDATAFGIPKFNPPAPAQQAVPEVPQDAVVEAHAAQEQAQAERQAALAEQHGGWETAATNFFRGGLDALLSPGAAAGLTLETAGEVLGNKALHDFGRDLGTASSGKSAMEALAFVLGGGGKEGAELADTSNQVLREQEEARPLLSTMSRMAGMAATGIGIGGVAGGKTAAATLIGMNAAEGAGAGAQAAYEESAPLRDVLASAAVGALIGGGATAAVEGLAYGVRKAAPELAKVFGKVQKAADKASLASVVGEDAAVWNQVAKDPERMARMAEMARTVKSEHEAVSAIEAGAARYAAEEQALAKGLDEAFPQGAPVSMLQDADALIAQKLERATTGEARAAAQSLKNTIEPFQERLAIKQADAFGKEVTIGYRNPSYSDLVQLRADLRGIGAPGVAKKELVDLLTDGINGAAEQAGPRAAKLWRETMQSADDAHLILGALNRGAVKEASGAGKAFHTGTVTTLISALASGHPIAALAHGLVAGVGHAALEKVGAQAFSKLANKFASMTARVPLRAAGGPEMQEVLSMLAKTKQFASEMAESAGANPVARQEAEELARNVASKQIEKAAGQFSVENWFTREPTALQKVFYRGQLLDKISEDVASTAARTTALHPSIPETLDVSRLSRITRDATPESIGMLQSTMQQIASSTPRTPSGEMAGVAARQAINDLDRANPAMAMAKGNATANYLDELARSAQDEGTQQFAATAAKSVREALASDAFGEAGKAYQAILNAPDLGKMSDAVSVREALRGLQEPGALSSSLRNAQNKVSAAYDALSKLTGEAAPKGLAKGFEASQAMLEAAEKAVTIDGKPMRAVLDAAQRPMSAATGKTISETTVSDAVDGELDHLTPVLRDAATGGSPRLYRPMSGAAAAAALPLTVEEEREQYDKRLKQLTGASTNPAGAEGQHPMIAAEAGNKISQLLTDIPKPPSGPLGSEGPQAMSADDLRLANAMWEATMEPGSVIRDLASGYVDPDKAAYAWKQYPGYQRAAQAGILDVLSHDLTQEERNMLPENLLTQLDATFGFGGRLQETSDPFFAARMSEMYRTPPEKRAPPQPNGVLKLPGSDPTFTERIAEG